MFVSYYIHKILQLYISLTKDCLASSYILLLFFVGTFAYLLRGLFLHVIQSSPFKVLLKVLNVLFKVIFGRLLSYSKKSKIRRNDLFFSLDVISCLLFSLVLPLVVTRCTTRFHSLPLVVIRCHSLYH